MGEALRQVLPDEVRAALVALGENIQLQAINAREIAAVLARLDALPPEIAVRADAEIADALGLVIRGRFGQVAIWHRSDRDLLAKHPALTRLFLFHRDGRLREAALERLADGAESPFAFAAIAYRLNDWAAPVRRAAASCARRVFPATDGKVVAEAGLALLLRHRSWLRWADEASILDEAIWRPDALAHLADALAAARSGPAGALLRTALRRPGLDGRLPHLARQAVLPSVRALALWTLIQGEATWPAGHGWEWVDKVYGIRRRVPLFAAREVARPEPLESLVEMGARDRSAMVRKVAAEGLVRHRDDVADPERLVRLLRPRETRAIRERLDFVMAERGASARS